VSSITAAEDGPNWMICVLDCEFGMSSFPLVIGRDLPASEMAQALGRMAPDRITNIE
jgi:hypothetical protein